MRVNELSKQIGKSNKEVLEILQKNHFDVKSHSSKVTEEQAEYLSNIKVSGDALLTIINDILDLSKIEAGTLEYVYANVDIN